MKKVLEATITVALIVLLYPFVYGYRSIMNFRREVHKIFKMRLRDFILIGTMYMMMMMIVVIIIYIIGCALWLILPESAFVK